jgi:hypothetical protein
MLKVTRFRINRISTTKCKILREMSGFRGGDYEECRRIKCDIV